MSIAKPLNIAWVGTGVMGASMCKFLVAKPELYNVSVWNRTASKRDELLSLGAHPFEFDQLQSPNTFDVLILMVGGPNDVEEILITLNVITNLPENSLIIDHTSSSPDIAIKVHDLAKSRNILSLDAPVSGGDMQAKNGTLTIMAGGTSEAFEKSKNILENYSKNLHHMGKPGSGHHTKIANQICVASNIAAFCESLMYARGAGLNLDGWYTMIAAGSGGSFIIDWLGPRVLARDLKNGGAAKYMVKDLEMGMDECKKLGVALPNTALNVQFLRSLLASGDGDLALQAVVKVYEKLSGMNFD